LEIQCERNKLDILDFFVNRLLIEPAKSFLLWEEQITILILPCFCKDSFPEFLNIRNLFLSGTRILTYAE